MPRMLCTTRMPSAALALEKAQVLGSAITDGAGWDVPARLSLCARGQAKLYGTVGRDDATTMIDVVSGGFGSPCQRTSAAATAPTHLSRVVWVGEARAPSGQRIRYAVNGLSDYLRGFHNSTTIVTITECNNS